MAAEFMRESGSSGWFHYAARWRCCKRCLSFASCPLFQNGFVAAEVAVCGCDGVQALVATRYANTSCEKVIDVSMTAKFQIDAKLKRLNVLRDDHFETHTDEINRVMSVR